MPMPLWHVPSSGSKIESAASGLVFRHFYSTALFTAHRYEEAFVVRQKQPDYFIDFDFLRCGDAGTARPPR